MCWFIELLFVKILSHKEQGNFFPKCNESLCACKRIFIYVLDNLLLTFKFAFLEKFFPQSVQGKISIGPLCFSFLCPNRDLLEVKSLPQSGHINRSMLACTSLVTKKFEMLYKILVCGVV